MVLLTPRIHFFEINDQPWLPPFIRARVQACLTLMWTLRIPLIQSTSPAALVAKTLQKQLGHHTREYTYVDFCAGAGGPTPLIEQSLNASLAAANPSSGGNPVDFVLTDIAPHIPAWRAAAAKSENLFYVPASVDAARAPAGLLDSVVPVARQAAHDQASQPKIFRLYNLAFHHFPDSLASSILKNTLETSSGFGIFELQSRTASSLLTVTLMWPLLILITPFYFWHDPLHLFFTYVVPVIPFVLVFDGWVSSLRTRSAGEVAGLVSGGEGAGEGGRGGEGDGDDDDAEALWRDWEIRSGSEVHTWPIGEMTWIVGRRRE